MSNLVLLIEPDAQEGDFYAEILEELSGGKVDRVIPDQGTLDRVSPASYQVILLDASAFQSPEAELGWIERIRNANPAASLVVISDRATVEQAVAAVRLGVEDYLRKPVSIDAFRLAIKRGLDRKTVFAGSVGLTSYLHLVTGCQLISAATDADKIHEVVQAYFRQELSSQYAATYVKGVRVGADKGDPVQQLLSIAAESANVFDRLARPGAQPYHFVEQGSLAPGLFIFRYKDLNGDPVDCVCLSPKSPENPKEFDQRVKLLTRQIEVSLANLKQFQGVKELIYVDDATGLYNTRYLNDVLEKEIAQARAGKSSFAVLFIDADHFKSVNDRHGHLVGTSLLNELGDQIKNLVRDQDIVFRYGGDEFVAVLRRADLQTAGLVAERIRKGIEGRKFLESEGLEVRFTVSVGVAIFPDHAVTKKEIIDIADRAMYEAKRQSRNRVFVLPARKATKAVV